MKKIRKERKVEILSKLYKIYNYSNLSSESSFPTITSGLLTSKKILPPTMLGPRVTLDKSQVLANHFQKAVGTLVYRRNLFRSY